MEIKITNAIETISHDGLNNHQLTNNLTKGNDTIATIAVGFKVLNTVKDSFVLNTTTGAAFSETVDVTNAAFIHVQCNKYIESPTDLPDPRRLNVNYNAASIGNMSQFQITNCDDIKALVLSNVVVPATEKVVLTIIKGYHT